MFSFSRRPARVSTAAAANERSKTRRSVATPEQPDWIAIRRKERPQDLELAPHAVRWWHALPSEVRPVHLVQKFPRIVNLVAQCWDDPRLLRETFQSLLQDKRGTRQGFPTMIISELRRLREHSAHAVPAAVESPRSELLPMASWQAEAAGARNGPSRAANLSDAWDMHWEQAGDR